MAGSDMSGMEDSDLLAMRQCMGHFFYPDLSHVIIVYGHPSYEGRIHTYPGKINDLLETYQGKT